MSKKSEKVKTQTWNESFAAFGEPEKDSRRKKAEGKKKETEKDAPEIEEDKEVEQKENKNEETKGKDVVGDETRLYVMNLPFSVTEQSL